MEIHATFAPDGDAKTACAAASPVQFLTPEGRWQPNAAAEPFADELTGLDTEFWLGALQHMVEVRAFDREATMLQRQGELGLFAQCEGQEAAQIGSALALRSQDEVFPSYREHGVCHVRSVDLVDILRLFRGHSHGGWDPREHRVRNYTLVIAAHALHAAGYAMGQRFDGSVGSGNRERDEATMLYFGDGSTSQGEANEALVFAASYQAPLVFFLQNNGWAISVPVERQSRTPLADRARGFGMPADRIDGNDVFASYAVSRRRLDEARAGMGPAYIEAVTYRMGAHTTSDDPTKYRQADEVERWRQRDPISRLRAWLTSEGVDAAELARIEERANDLAADIRRRCRELDPPVLDEMFTHVYAEQHPVIEEQRAWLERYEASFEADPDAGGHLAEPSADGVSKEAQA